MKTKIFTVYDSKAECFSAPSFIGATGQATRSFEASANTPDNDFNKYPGDFTLFEIGTWDDEKAIITMYESKVNLGTALEYKTSSNIPDVVNLNTASEAKYNENEK